MTTTGAPDTTGLPAARLWPAPMRALWHLRSFRTTRRKAPRKKAAMNMTLSSPAQCEFVLASSNQKA